MSRLGFFASKKEDEPNITDLSENSVDDLILISNKATTDFDSLPSREYSEELQNKIDMIKRQTNYTDTEFIAEKLTVHNGNEMNVIKEYMGIPLHKKKGPIGSLNQEIYRQIREHTKVSIPFYK